MKKWMMLAILMVFGSISAAGDTLAMVPDQDGPDAPGMRAEYDRVTAGKMKKYDRLKLEIAELRSRIEDLREKERELLGEKEIAGKAFSEADKAAENAGTNVKKVLEVASGEDEKMRLFAEAGAKESGERREKIKKLQGDLKEVQDRMKELQDSKNRAEEGSAAREKEYKDTLELAAQLKDKSTAEKKSAPAAGAEEARLKTRISEMEAKVQEGEHLKQQLSEEILASAEKIRVVEDEISALEVQDSSKAKELKEKIANFDKARTEDNGKGPAIESLKKGAAEADATRLKTKAALQNIEEEVGKVSGEKILAGKDLAERTDELKVRISALIVKSERDQALLPENAGDDEKDLKKRLKRAEKDVVELQRKTEKALMINKAFKEKFDKEMLKKHFNLAVVYEMNGLYKDAEKEYRECLKIDPTDSDTHYNLAILYDDRLNDNKKAKKHYYKFLALRPIEEPGEIVREWIMRAELEKRLGSTVR